MYSSFLLLLLVYSAKKCRAVFSRVGALKRLWFPQRVIRCARTVLSRDVEKKERNQRWTKTSLRLGHNVYQVSIIIIDKFYINIFEQMSVCLW